MTAFQEASRNLGIAIYYSRLAAYGVTGDVIAFDSLPVVEQRDWIETAQRVLSEGQTPPLHGKVVARITPQTPWGETA